MGKGSADGDLIVAKAQIFAGREIDNVFARVNKGEGVITGEFIIAFSDGSHLTIEPDKERVGVARLLADERGSAVFTFGTTAKTFANLAIDGQKIRAEYCKASGFQGWVFSAIFSLTDSDGNLSGSPPYILFANKRSLILHIKSEPSKWYPLLLEGGGDEVIWEDLAEDEARQVSGIRTYNKCLSD